MEPADRTIDHPDLSQWLRDARAVADEVQPLFDTLTEAQLTWKPAPDVWSIAECVEHLIVMGRLYYPRIAEAIERADTATGTPPPHRPTLMGRLFYWIVRPGGLKVKTFGLFKPKPMAVNAGTGDRFLRQQDELLDLLHRAAAVDLNSARFSSPLSSLIRFNVGDGLRVMVAHQQRHLQQARGVRQRPDFPEA
ncbi:MAG: DinB family protein [Bacteroidetes bacterium]|jgi:hypothetical protein|nr:DinB family protein [Bacteroidota bacterium]